MNLQNCGNCGARILTTSGVCTLCGNSPFAQVVKSDHNKNIVELDTELATLREKLVEAEREKSGISASAEKLDSIRRILGGESVESEDEVVRHVAFLYRCMKWIGENYGHILVGMALEAKQKDTTDAE